MRFPIEQPFEFGHDRGPVKASSKRMSLLLRWTWGFILSRKQIRISQSGWMELGVTNSSCCDARMPHCTWCFKPCTSTSSIDSKNAYSAGLCCCRTIPSSLRLLDLPIVILRLRDFLLGRWLCKIFPTTTKSSIRNQSSRFVKLENPKPVSHL